MKNRLALRAYVGAVRRNLRVGLAASVGFAVGLVPFCMIYLPVLATLPGRSFDEYLFYAATARDLFNVGPHNQVWGRLLGSLNVIPEDHLDNSEVVLAITPILLIAYLASVIAVLSGRVLAEAKDRVTKRVRRLVCGICGNRADNAEILGALAVRAGVGCGAGRR